MLTTTKRTTIPGTIKLTLEYKEVLFHRNRVTSVIYRGTDEENDRDITVNFDPDLFEDDAYPPAIEATFTALPGESDG
jgi:hypothetical protein